MKSVDNSEIEKYKDEVKEKWGKTASYNEYLEKTKGYSKESYNNLVMEIDAIMAEFAVCVKNGDNPDSIASLNLVKKLQTYITNNFYNCTNEILFSLGQMYVLDSRFKDNIDKHANGTAEYILKAIKFYCKK